MIVYVLVAVAVLLCFIIYIAEKNFYRRKQKHNTKELNKLVEDVHEKLGESDYNNQSVPVEQYSVPEMIEEVVPVLASENNDVIIEPIIQTIQTVEKPTIEIISEEAPILLLDEDDTEQLPVEEENLVLEQMPEVEIPKEKIPEILEVIEQVEEIQYTSMEPNPTDAQKELEKLTEELRKQQEEQTTIQLTHFEQEQEENAIISLEELMAKGDLLYEKNEMSQYQDEGDEPISIQDLEAKYRNQKIEIEEVSKQIDEEVQKPMVKLDDFYQTKVEAQAVKNYSEEKIFKSSPVISPIYGIENNIKKLEARNTKLELEDTANYDKLDEEIRKTNEFLNILRELQKKLD